MENSTVIRIEGLSKTYDDNEVLKNINLDISSGNVIGYIGPNGAGKSTTVKILAGLIPKFKGSVKILGYDLEKEPLEIKKRIGYVPENAELYDVLTPLEYLQFIGDLHEMPRKTATERANKLLNFFGLSAQKQKRMDTFSKGMRQKVLLISGLLHNPEIIFLDEPLSGLDANAVMMVKEIIARLAREGKTIFYCSHMMDIVEKVSDRILLINQGQIIADGTFAQLKASGDESLEKIFAKLTGNVDDTDRSEEFIKAFRD